MSSVHSQESDVVTEESAQKQLKTGGSGMGTPTRTSSNNSNKSTITFEKQKVMPRMRTHSVQSVLSSISLRSMMGAHQEEQSEHSNVGSAVPAGLNATQQIQSPAMASVRKRTTSLNNGDGIGQKLPFTDDKRRQLELEALGQGRFSKRGQSSTQVATLGSRQVPCVREGERVSTKKGSFADHAQDKIDSSDPVATDVNSAVSSYEDDAEDDDPAQQKKLTTDALRKLSAFKRINTEAHTFPTPQPSDDSLVGEELTQIPFGGKNIILDSSIPSNKRGSIVTVKHPGDIMTPTIDSSMRSKSKRPIRQINMPKKPLYTPAVLRDVSETNITNAELNAQTPQPLPIHTTAGLTSRSSVKSMQSTTSSIISEYTKRLSSRWGKSPSYIKTPEITPPTKDHWVPDSKRHACHYCHKIFSFWERKHHCRHCGDVFCSQHVRHWLYLDPNAQFVIGGAGIGALSKICDGCLQEYETLVRGGPSSDAAPQKNNFETTPSPMPGIDTQLEQAEPTNPESKQRERMDSIVGSVPADWNWSSF
ncbi:LAFE_0D03466g1_1 [Lachancea fermentati]|uniref:LAFE_0D03466g1_1 n=1 Tax=Lachancea fermentati TaxID=4955 RepID=A0A1G4MB01_LACFM|nr:LAFE_0D03466g1_1 [Lachancea fermentati]